ncbi:MAG TPA: DUF3455 domain-containing protein [Kofleriaceae bacterium]|nr:DUF3455 domain-containing protein [Kofleriaceae bacterium]
MKLWLSSTLLVASCVSGADPLTSTDQAISTRHACPANVPATLAPAADQDLAFALDATGTQNYKCAATSTGYAWTFVAPEALLYRTEERCHDRDPVVHHFAGPTWQALDDGSSVVGTKVAAATVDTTAIPWLLLTAASHGAPTDGEDEGLMTPITAVQRLSTGGGLAPATGCDADHLGATADVPYTARYFFYRTHAHHPEHNVRCGG